MLLPLLLIALGMAGCVEERVVKSSWDNLAELADPKPGESDGGDAGFSRQGWTIELERFTGEDRIKRAYGFAATVRESGQIADVWFTDIDADTVVFAGRFRRADSDEAKQTLAAIRGAKIEGGRPFRDARIVPITRGRAGVDEYDLSRHSGYRTLLIAVFDKNYGGNFRRDAERHAAELRIEHDMGDIFYFHGPNQSVVTAGLFTQGDFVPVNGVDTYGPRIHKLQETFPYALRNGKTITNPEAAATDGIEPSIIVNVP